MVREIINPQSEEIHLDIISKDPFLYSKLTKRIDS